MYSSDIIYAEKMSLKPEKNLINTMRALHQRFEFRWGRAIDAERFRLSFEVAAPETIEDINDIVLTDWR